MKRRQSCDWHERRKGITRKRLPGISIGRVEREEEHENMKIEEWASQRKIAGEGSVLSLSSAAAAMKAAACRIAHEEPINVSALSLAIEMSYLSAVSNLAISAIWLTMTTKYVAKHHPSYIVASRSVFIRLAEANGWLEIGSLQPISQCINGVA